MSAWPRLGHGTSVIGSAAVALVATLTGCSDSEPSSSTSSTAVAEATASTTATVPAAPRLAAGDKYVALGSSIASGFGISVQSTDCGRSSRNYPQLIAARYQLALTDVSCGGATIPNIVDTPQAGNAPQISAVTPDTKLVTVTIGGNDILYNATAVGCGVPDGICTVPPSLQADLVTTRAALGSMLREIRAVAPDATIVFVTYPREVPEGNCPELGYADEEAAIVRSMGEDLERMFVEVVGADPDVVLVDPYVAPGDHTGCAPVDERWAAGKVADDGFAYHPTALGHEVMANMVAEALGG